MCLGSYILRVCKCHACIDVFRSTFPGGFPRKTKPTFTKIEWIYMHFAELLQNIRFGLMFPFQTPPTSSPQPMHVQLLFYPGHETWRYVQAMCTNTPVLHRNYNLHKSIKLSSEDNQTRRGSHTVNTEAENFSLRVSQDTTHSSRARDPGTLLLSKWFCVNGKCAFRKYPCRVQLVKCQILCLEFASLDKATMRVGSTYTQSLQ